MDGKSEVHQQGKDIHSDVDSTPTSGWTFKYILIIFSAYLTIPGISYTISSLNAPIELIKEFMNQTQYERDGTWMDQDKVDTLFGLLVALVGLGSAAGSLTANSLADCVGRKGVIILASFSGIVGVVLMALCRVTNSYEVLLVGRVSTGVTIGWGYTTAMAYAVEMSLPSMRGSVALISQLFQSFSFVIAQVMGYTELLGNEEHWHLLLGFPVIFFGLQLIIFPFCPESPRYLLMKKNDIAGATRALQTIRSKIDVSKDIAQLYTELKESATQTEVSVFDLFKSKHLRRPLIITIVLGVQQNWSGHNGILFFSTQLFRSAGLSERDARYATSGTGTTFFVCNLITAFLLPRFRRKTLFQFGIILMAVCSGVVGLTMLFQDKVEELIYVNIVVSLMIIAFFAIGPISVFWVMLSELFPHSARGTGLNIALLCSMLSFFSHCYIFPLLLSKLHSYIFFVFCGIDLLTAVFVFFYVPETKNKTFAEIAKSWAPVKSFENPLALNTGCNHEITVERIDSTVYNSEQTDGENTKF